MCYTNNKQLGYNNRYTCVLVSCMLCEKQIGLMCNSTDLRLNGTDKIVCGVCFDLNTDRVIEEVLSI